MTPPSSSSSFPGGSRPGGSGPANQLATPAPAGVIGRYQVLEKIGEGGMGSLFLARDPAIDRLVAIKLLRRGFDTEALRERFAREARAAGRLRHPNIVTVFDVGEHDGDPFIAMEFLAGETLGELIRHGAGLSLARRLKLLEELCDGLAYAHRAGLVHRDVKPANLMVDAEGVLKILDFGIVRVSDSGMTQAGVLVGTINYMSPEQVLGTGVDHRSDIFAVGLVAYELLSGRQAFAGTMKDGLLKRIPEAEVEPLAKVVPGLDPDVIAIVGQSLQKNPADRYQDLARMRNDLARARQRIEVEEERAAIEAASAAAETAFISEEPTAPGVVLEAPSRPGSGLIADAERALSEGNYRAALSIAGRAAALDPQDRNPSSIVARAEAGLLDRGRTFDGAQAATPQSRGGVALPASTPSAPPPTAGTVQQSQRATYLAIAVAIVALGVAGFAVWSQFGNVRREPNSIAAGTQPPQSPGGPVASSTGAPAPASGTDPAASPPVTSTPRQAEPPDPVPIEPNPAEQRPAEQRGQTTRQPERQPDRSTARGNDRRGSPPAGRQQSQTAERPAPPAAADGTAPPVVDRPRNEPATQPPVSGVPMTEGAKPLSTLPGSQAARPTTPAPPPKPPDPKPEPKMEAPPRDPRVDAEAEVRRTLDRYRAAWVARDFGALSQVHALSGAEARSVRANMESMREYEMTLEGVTVDVAADARTATASARVNRRFLGPVGGRQQRTVTQTFDFARRGDSWIITTVR